jgi:ribosomal protein L7Ae-like RNA K-turn-binding protein
MADINDFDTTLKKAVVSSFYEGLVCKGLHEVCKGIEAKKVKFVILAENVDEAQYKKLVTALCK